MRVISGSAKSLKLKTIEGMDTRPTQDRIKETLFNMIQYDIPGCRFLDLFAGSGGIGIEALSRGAEKVYFIENAKKAQNCIRENLKYTRLYDRGELLAEDVISGIRKLEARKEIFDFIFLDPPYNKGFEELVLRELDKSVICDEDTVVITESSLNTEIPEVFDWLKVTKVKTYKTNKHTFLRKS